MNKSNLNINKLNDAWIIHREEVTTEVDGLCNGCFIIDAYSGFCLGGEFFIEQPTQARIIHLFEAAVDKAYGVKPKKILIGSQEPYVDELISIFKKIDVELYPIVQKELVVYLQEFVQGFQEFSGNAHYKPYLDEINSISDEQMAQVMLPESYSLCPCASGEKYKFCCQKALGDIVCACNAAEDGNLKDALLHLQEAEAKVGRTAEIVCRYAICWSFFDKEKYSQYIQEAIAINPNHPRTNYLLGIEAKEKEQYELAIKYYNKAIAHYPKSDKFHLSEAYNNLGTVYYHLQNYQKAKESWEQGFILLPFDETTRNNLFNCIYNNELLPFHIRQQSPFMRRFIE